MVKYQFFLDEFFHLRDFMLYRTLFLFNELMIIFLLLLQTVFDALSDIEGFIVALHHFIFFHQNASCNEHVERVINASSDVLLLF